MTETKTEQQPDQVEKPSEMLLIAIKKIPLIITVDLITDEDTWHSPKKRGEEFHFPKKEGKVLIKRRLVIEAK